MSEYKNMFKGMAAVVVLMLGGGSGVKPGSLLYRIGDGGLSGKSSVCGASDDRGHGLLWTVVPENQPGPRQISSESRRCAGGRSAIETAICRFP